jgi:hypothetical protein
MVNTTESEQEGDGDENGNEEAQEGMDSPDQLGEAANLCVKDQADDAPEPDDAEK